ncbi:MAG: hypothetical protein ABW065_03675 [Solirubrobacterales bacterium]
MVEPISEHEAHVHHVVEVMVEGTTSIQSYEIVRLGGHGRALVIGGRVQSTEADEAIYHEALLLPAFTFAPAVTRVLCLGGANGGILHRVLALPGVTEVRQFDLDAELHERTVEYLSYMHRDALNDPRALIGFGDPKGMLEDLEGPFDLILADLPDSVPGTHAPGMFTFEFYQRIRKLLGDAGMFATQAGPANPLGPAFMASVLRTAQEVFAHAHPFTSAVPAFGVPWGFVLASNHPFAPNSPGPRMVDVPDSVTTYDTETHHHMFAIPRLLRERLIATGRVITDDEPMVQA